jgi:hypothetical protein
MDAGAPADAWCAAALRRDVRDLFIVKAIEDGRQ